MVGSMRRDQAANGTFRQIVGIDPLKNTSMSAALDAKWARAASCRLLLPAMVASEYSLTAL